MPENTPLIAIVGGGLVGTTAALALAKKTSWKILLFDAKKHSKPFNANNLLDTRTLALNHASVAYLKSLGLWTLLELKACPIEQVHISEKNNFGSVLLSASEVDAKALGQVVEIKDLQEALQEALSHTSQIECLNGVEVHECTRHNSTWTLHTPQGHIKADYLLIADGTHSSLRHLLDIETNTYDYDQTAIVAVIQAQQPHQNIAYERFCQEETLAILPLTHDRIGTVLATSKKKAEKYMQLDEKAYLQKLQTLFGARLGKFNAIGQRQSYPLQRVIADHFVEDHCVILGNAAHTLNPIGAQGLNLGLAGVKDCVETLVKKASLRDFETRHQLRVNTLGKFTHETSLIFGSEAFPTRLARGAALTLLQHCFSLKKRLIRQMMG